jgi:hypothetical protein
MSGSVTISIKGTPERLKSTRLTLRPSGVVAWISFAVSSSRCARVIPIVTGPLDVSTASRPLDARGRSYWLIW